MKQFLESENFLRDIETQSLQNGAEAQALASGLTEAQLNWKPAADSWSMAQCLDHLANASRGFDPYFERALAGGRPTSAASPPSYRPTFMGKWLIKYVEPQSLRKLTAPKIFQPSTSNVEGALEKFLQQQERFRHFVSETVGRDYNKTRLRSPVTPLIRYSLADAFVITVLHEQRHLAQARRVRETPGFPN